jgi:glycosyltransferase involved in cell wall biosynthesis
MKGSEDKKFRIVHVCSGHNVDDARVFHRACLSLAGAGYEVHLIAQNKSYGCYEQQGVIIHSLAPVGTRFERIARRYKIAELASGLDPDLYHIHEPELLGPIISRAQGKPVIWDAHESYLDILDQREWIPAPFRWIAKYAWDRMEKHLLKKCTAVITVTERIALRYRRLHQTVRVIANYPKIMMNGHDYTPRADMTCVFAGGLCSDRGLFQIICALSILRRKGWQMKLLLAGPEAEDGFILKLFKAAKREGVEDLISYHGVLSKQDTSKLIASSQIGLVTYLPVGNNIMGMPTKLLECMSAGTPVVYSNFDSYSEIAGTYNAGISVNPLDPQEIADAIKRIIADPVLARRFGENGQRAVRNTFNWEVESKKLLDLYCTIFEDVHRF